MSLTDATPTVIQCCQLSPAAMAGWRYKIAPRHDRFTRYPTLRGTEANSDSSRKGKP